MEHRKAERSHMSCAWSAGRSPRRHRSSRPDRCDVLLLLVPSRDAGLLGLADAVGLVAVLAVRPGQADALLDSSPLPLPFHVIRWACTE